MTVIVEIAGKQFRVKQADKLNVPYLSGKPDDTVEFNNILASTEGETSKIGTPLIKGSVTAKIIEHGRGDKILVFKKKRRKGYQKMNGHRQDFTRIEITNLTLG